MEVNGAIVHQIKDAAKETAFPGALLATIGLNCSFMTSQLGRSISAGTPLYVVRLFVWVLGLLCLVLGLILLGLPKNDSLLEIRTDGLVFCKGRKSPICIPFSQLRSVSVVAFGPCDYVQLRRLRGRSVYFPVKSKAAGMALRAGIYGTVPSAPQTGREEKPADFMQNS